MSYNSPVFSLRQKHIKSTNSPVNFKLIFVFIFSLGLSFSGRAQVQTNQNDSLMLRKIYNTSLTEGYAYEWLDYLSNEIGARLSGSRNAEKVVNYTKEELEKLGAKVSLQSVQVPKWVRGAPEYAYIETQPGMTKSVNICALGSSVPTPGGGIKAEVVEVHNFEDLDSLGKEKIQGKIVFYNRPMDPTHIETFKAYGSAVDQRTHGAAEASKYGAVGVIVRSLTLRMDDLPHAGNMYYGNIPDDQKIPAAAISTNDAEYLSGILKLKPDTKFYFKTNCKNMGEVESHNVIAEIKGSEFPNQIILVGGHLDSWDLAQGAQDDGAGVTQAMEVMKLFKELDYQPKRTLRVVLFMNEENGLKGGKKYAEVAKAKNENHIFALESDAGGFTPRGFAFDTNQQRFEKILTWKSLFAPYLIHHFTLGGSDADVSALKNGKTVLAGLRPDSQRYFDYHHAANDVFDNVSRRELEMGAATMASLIYLVDQHGF